MKNTTIELAEHPADVVEAEETNTYDVIIIGGGVAGLSAALYSSRDGFSTLLLEGEYLSSTEMPGGALLLTPEIENFPGFLSGAGETLISQIHDQAEKFGTVILTESAHDVKLSSELYQDHVITSSTGVVYRSKAVILSTGAVARQLQVAGETNYLGRGVSTCATCDGFFFDGKKVAVVGGGDTAVEDALFLRRFATEVTMLVRKDTFKATGPEAREALALAADSSSGFRIIWNSSVQSVNGDDNTVTSLTYHTDDSVKELSVDGVFVAIGRDPSTSFLANSIVVLDDEGYIVTKSGTQAVAGDAVGVYAAGDAVDKKFRQAVTSAGRAVEAALEAREYLLELKRHFS